MSIDWSKLIHRPLVSFFVVEQCYSYCQGGDILSWDEAHGIWATATGKKLSKIDRVILHDTTAPVGADFLLGFNVVENINGSTVERTSSTQLTLETTIRCFLQADLPHNGPVLPVISEMVAITVRFDLQTMSSFWMSHTAAVDEGQGSDSVELLKSTNTTTFKAAMDALASGQVAPLPLGSVQGNARKEIRTEWSRLLRGLLCDEPSASSLQSPNRDLPHAVSNPSLTVAFRKAVLNGQTGVPDQPSAFVIEFEARFSSPKAESIQCLGVRRLHDDDAHARFGVAQKLDWYFRQRSAFLSSILGSRSAVIGFTPAEWILELSCLSHKSVADRIDEWTQSAVSGIKAYAGATGASFLPSVDPPDSGLEAVFTALYGVADRTNKFNYNNAELGVPANAVRDEVIVEPRSVLYVGHRLAGSTGDSLQHITLHFILCGTTTNGFLAATQTLSSPSLPDREGYHGFALYSAGPLEFANGTQTVRMGALELAFGKRAGTGVVPIPTLFRLEFLGHYPQLQADAVFAITSVLPGGQDDLPADSYLAPNVVVEALPCRVLPIQIGTNSTDQQVEQAFYRPRPLLINRAVGSGNAALLLTAKERSDPSYNRTLRLSLDVDGAGSPSSAVAQQVVVLDSDPFLVAQLSFPQLLSQSQTLHLATWDNTTDGARWQIPLPSYDFTLTLPPQAMGEEMVKDNSFRPPPMDFRFGPSASVAMKTTPQATNYAEVPWNLRRVLGYAGQSLPGVTVDRLDYELIYGLSCDVSQPFVRLAEVFSLMGGIPGRLPVTIQAPDLRPLTALYSDWRLAWANLYQRYQSRLGVLEPWDGHVAGSLTLKQGMSCVIRYQIDNTAISKCNQTLISRGFTFPADVAVPNGITFPQADLEDPITPLSGPLTDTSLLRGGVTWGFESRNIFCATLRNEYSTKDSAAVSDLDMTALGGFGHQQASFDEGRTSIFADVEMGRTYYYKLERVGRIGVLWNKAKHVIVYERSVVPSRQFYQEQNPKTNPTASYGIPMLRKVEEYIEIIEEERRFPDDGLFTGVTTSKVQATPPQRCGCIVASVFPKGAKIHVSSAWGADVNSIDATQKQIPVGWKVPLWRRGAQPADVYPFPKISLSILSEFAGESKESPCDIANPEAMYFYTDARARTSADSDTWEAMIGVDTVDFPIPSPPTGVSKQKYPAFPTAGDVPVLAGFSPCTFQLLPSPRPANIVANRGGSPMAAVLDTITLMRGCNQTRPAWASGSSPDILMTNYQAIWEDLLNGPIPPQWDAAALKASIGPKLDSLKTSLQNVGNDITKKWTGNWTRAVLDLNEKAAVNLQNQIRTATSDGQKIAGGVLQVLQDVQDGIQRIKAAQATAQAVADALTHLVQEQFAAFQHAVMNASSTPGVLSSLFSQYLIGAQGIVRGVAQAISQLKALVATLPASEDAAADLVANVTKQALALRDQLNQIWISAGQHRPLPELADITSELAAGPLAKFSGELQQKLQAFADAVTSTKSTFNERLTEIKSKIDVLASFSKDVDAELAIYATALRAGFKSLEPALDADTTLRTYLDCFRAEVTQVRDQGKNWASTTFNNLITTIASGGVDVIDKVQKGFTDAFDGTGSTFGAYLGDLNSALTDEVNKFGASSAFVTALTSFAAFVGNGLSKLSDDFFTAVDQATDLQRAVLDFRDAKLAEVHKYLDKNLAILRPAVADITANTSQLLSLARCFGAAPVVDTLNFLPGRIGYYFLSAPVGQVDLSPVTATLLRAGNAVANDATNILNDALSVMKLQIPTVSLADRLVPPDLSNFKLSDIFPKFSGLDLSGLFKDINLNEDGSKIRIQHGADPQTRSAWVQATVGAHLQDVPIFETGGVSLRLATADFGGTVRVDVNAQGTRQLASGSVTGDWKLLVLGQEVVTLTATQLIFDSTGKLQFLVNPKNVKLPGVLNFVSDYLSKFLSKESGLSVQVHGTQINALLSLPIPDMQGLTTGMSNLSLVCNFGIGLNGTQFQLDVGFGLSTPDKPFNIAIFILGGAGYINATTSFAPASGRPPDCHVDFGIMASASLAIAFGPISGGVYAFLGIRASFQTGGPGLNLTAVLILRGQVNLAGIISASVCMELSVSDEAGRLIGRGHFSISISICWCFTLNIDTDITFPLGGSSGQSVAMLEPGRRDAKVAALWSAESVRSGPLESDDAPEPFLPAVADDLANFVEDYVAMTGGA